MASYVQVPVPEDRLIEVFALLAGSAAIPAIDDGSSNRPIVGEGERKESSQAAFWSKRGHVLEHLAPRSKLARATLRYLAAHAGERLGVPEIAAGLGEAPDKVGGAIGPLTVYLGNRGLDLPYDWDQSEADGRVRMQMERGVADAILAVVPVP